MLEVTALAKRLMRTGKGAAVAGAAPPSPTACIGISATGGVTRGWRSARGACSSGTLCGARGVSPLRPCARQQGLLAWQAVSVNLSHSASIVAFCVGMGWRADCITPGARMLRARLPGELSSAPWVATS